MFVVASQDLPPIAYDNLNRFMVSDRFIHLGWTNTKEWCHCIDLYIDSFPRGSGNTIFEAVFAGKPCVIMDTRENRESSALNYLDPLQSSRLSIGITKSADEHFAQSSRLIQSPELRKAISENQYRILSGLTNSSHLFAKDYLNYFLSANLSLH